MLLPEKISIICGVVLARVVVLGNRDAEMVAVENSLNRMIRDIAANRDQCRAMASRNREDADVCNAKARAYNVALWIIHREVVLARVGGSRINCDAIPLERIDDEIDGIVGESSVDAYAHAVRATKTVMAQYRV